MKQEIIIVVILLLASCVQVSNQADTYAKVIIDKIRQLICDSPVLNNAHDVITNMAGVDNEVKGIIAKFKEVICNPVLENTFDIIANITKGLCK